MEEGTETGHITCTFKRDPRRLELYPTTDPEISMVEEPMLQVLNTVEE